MYMYIYTTTKGIFCTSFFCTVSTFIMPYMSFIKSIVIFGHERIVFQISSSIRQILCMYQILTPSHLSKITSKNFYGFSYT